MVEASGENVARLAEAALDDSTFSDWEFLKPIMNPFSARIDYLYTWDSVLKSHLHYPHIVIVVFYPLPVNRHPFSLPESVARYCCGTGGKFSPLVPHFRTGEECIHSHSAGILALLPLPYLLPLSCT